MRAWESFARDPADTAEQRADKITAFIVAGSCCVAGIVWTAMYLAVFGWGLTAALPLLFIVVVGTALGVSHVLRDHRYVVYAQIVCIIGITTTISWSIGGVFESGVVLIWAFLGPMAALLFFSRREAFVWFGVFLVAVLATVAGNIVLGEGDTVSNTTQLLFLAMNLSVASIVVFAFSGYFVTQAVEERARANRLLLNVLPPSIAPLLKASDDTIAEYFDSATVLFADVVGSTPLFAQLDPAEAVEMLNEAFSRFDALLEVHGVEKIRTIGDNYMVVAGAPVRRDDHAQAVCAFALDMVACLESLPPGADRLAFRIGVNSGPLVGGVIGTHKFHYDVWGDTVNIASRMESHGEAGRIHLTKTTVDLLGDGWRCEPRGAIEVKGRGPLETGFLLSGPARSS